MFWIWLYILCMPLPEVCEVYQHHYIWIIYFQVVIQVIKNVAAFEWISMRT